MKKSLLIIVALGILSACNHTDTWSVSGNITNAPANAKIAVERLAGNGWILIDSVKINGDGSFDYQAPADIPVHDIYRIGYNGKSVYFPIDSIESVTIDANANAFDTDYTVSGSQLAQTMMDIDKSINDALSTQGADYVCNNADYRRNIEEIIVNDSTGILSYYFINKRIGDKPLFSDLKARDVAILGAVANKYSMLYPNDPRTLALVRRHTAARANMRPNQGYKIEAEETGLIDISLLDQNGVRQTLSDVASNAGFTILNFTGYDSDFSVAMNAEIKRIIDEYAAYNPAVYQVSFDDNESEWYATAINLPWVTVLCPPADIQNIVLHYNVDHLPLTYVINSNGDLVERIDYATLVKDNSALQRAVKAHL